MTDGRPPWSMGRMTRDLALLIAALVLLAIGVPNASGAEVSPDGPQSPPLAIASCGSEDWMSEVRSEEQPEPSPAIGPASSPGRL